jgi:D-galactarolactone cycloisomerase
LKITEINVWALRAPIDQPFCFSQGWVRERAATLVEVRTDDGLAGWGEALCQGLQPPEIAAATVRHAFAPMLVGQDPERPEVHWHAMYNRSRDFGLKGAVIAAISAIDIALWDLCGQAQGRPVHALLGGAFRDRVQAYATGFYRIEGRGESARLADEARRHYDNGFRAMKVKLGFGVRDDIAVMEAIGAALQGKDVELMVDTNHAYGFAEAKELGLALAAFGLRWYEEPVVQEDLRGYAALRQALPMPIAGGENEFTAFGFRSLLAAEAIDVAQPDIAAAGGFTACRHIAALAHAHGVAVNPHVWGSSVSQAASLQLIAALPTAHPSLLAKQPIFEYDQSLHPFRRELVAHPLEQESGWVRISDRPGLGIEVDRAMVERYAQPL